MNSRKKKISYRQFLHKEYEILHAPYQPEMDFFKAIRYGQIKKVQELCSESFIEKKGLGTLSKQPLQNMKYHFTISTAVIARECIDGGLSLPESYSMSDYYIQHVDIASSLDEISDLHDEMCLAYAKRMHELNKQSIASRAVSKCIDYIYEHLHTRITIDILAELCGLSEAYLSRLFKKETGYTISSYILSKKLETAKSMLAYSDYSIAEISASLAFPSQSYFSNALKKECGLTPLKYRNQNPV